MRITEAPELKLSVALVTLLRKKSSISDGYHDFVCLDTGLIAHHTLVDRYELQLEKDIEQPRGWQLGVFIGHQLFHQQNLATNDTEGNREKYGSLILAAGDVDRDRSVRPVKGIACKLRSAGPLILEAQKNSMPVTFYLPLQDLGAEDEEAIRSIQERYANLHIASMERVDFGTPLPHLTEATPEQTTSALQRSRPAASASQTRNRRVFWWSAAITLPYAAMAIFALGEGDSPAPSERHGLNAQIYVSP